MGFFKVAVLSVDNDLSGKEEEDTQLEFGTEANREPDAVGLRYIDNGETQAGNIGAEQGTDGEGNFSSERSGDDDGLEIGGVDPGVSLPGVLTFVFRTKVDVVDVSAVFVFASSEMKGILDLVFRGQGKEPCRDPVL